MKNVSSKCVSTLNLGNKDSKGKVRSRRDSFSCVGPNAEAFTERWFRLCGNLLFYLKTTDHWSEPVGVIVLENFTIRIDSKTSNYQSYHFVVGFESGGYHSFGALSESERTSWMDALQSASFSSIRSKLDSLKLQIQSRMGRPQSSPSSLGPTDLPVHSNSPKACGYVKDVSESPLCEISLACDNLLCDSHGRAPNAKLVVHVRNSQNSVWLKYASTEVVEKSSNPVFLTTVSFRASDGLSETSQARFTVYEVRERTTQTQTVVGQLTVELSSLKAIDRIRLPISSSSSQAGSTPNQYAGFLSIVVWNLEREERCSTESTPCRTNPYESDSLLFSHRRTQSLPPRLGCKLKIPLQNNFGLLFSHPFMQTYRFHSGLGGDIFVHEIMAESKFSFLFPQQLLSVWIAEEKELLQEMIGLGELREPWHSRQVQILERHLWLINVYTQARQNLFHHKGADFKQSSTKADPTYEFVPLNLHLQRIWAQNESLHKSGFHDTITVGAFTAYSQRYENGGLVKLLQSWKHFGEKGSKGQASWYATNKVNMTYDSVQGIKRLRREIVERMQIIMKLAKERKTQGMHKFVEDIYHRCRLLLSICDQSLIEEAFEFLEHQKLTLPTSTSLDFDTIEEHYRQVDEGIDTPNSPIRSVVEMFKKRTEAGSVKDEDRTPDSGLGIEDIVKSFLDSPSSNYYRPSEEPEPWDLTQLNIEASVISLNSKVKVLCGVGANIQSNFLRPSNSVQRYHSVHSHTNNASSPKVETRRTQVAQWRKSMREETSQEKEKAISLAPLSLPVPIISSVYPHQNGFDRQHTNPTNNNMMITELSHTSDWSEELRASVKKLRMAMDGLLKTSRLAHSIFRLQENNEKAQLGYIVKYRRDVCFSHALTSLVAGLMSRLWCRKPDPTFLYVVTRLGPLISFHSFLTYHSHEAEMFSDMIVAIEDLKTVEFVMVLYDGKIHGQQGGNSEDSSMNCPMPKVHGSRSTLKVLLPVPESIFSMLPADSSRSTSFVITPVFFNIGINEQATLAERFGNLEPQDKSNLDNFARLNEYFRRYKKLTLPVKFTSKRNQAVEPNIDSLLDRMHQEILSKKKKNVEIIHLSSQITRLMMGLRFTSCKSGKDRTSMAVTLEQCQILSQEYDLAEHEYQLALDAFRSEGCRRENTLKNIGQRKYAFNSLQAFALPKLYRPSPGTFGNVQS
ncbi:unnamed protein product [Allacma fusca]|uniref:Phosphatidylinositol-3,4-bisphosphate 4-phosphatase n=1 Tax=Allacma fusca TaxID=39272 RepID=A0A8J2JKI3_9HEXA|nr:unnamed protein product [Allacma fusca]